MVSSSQQAVFFGLIALLLVSCSAQKPATTEPENAAPVSETRSTIDDRPNAAPPSAAYTPSATASEPQSSSSGFGSLFSVIQPNIVNGFEELLWSDLMPEGEEEAYMQMRMDMQVRFFDIVEGSAEDQPFIQTGSYNVVEELNGLKVRLPGFVVPLELTEDLKMVQFLLVPQYGACLHAPPPPPNQTIFVTMEEPIKLIHEAQPVWVHGTLITETQHSDLADAAYTIQMEEVKPLRY